MAKKLKIRFAKFEKALVMQILEQKGDFARSMNIGIGERPELYCGAIYLRGSDKRCDFRCDVCHFDSNAERDEYLANVINWITNEQFSNAGELKVGEMCEVKTGEACALYDSATERWVVRELLALLPAQCGFRFIFATEATSSGWACADHARPHAQRVEPKIDGDVYTWEM